jgi:hypothetical protein
MAPLSPSPGLAVAIAVTVVLIAWFLFQLIVLAAGTNSCHITGSHGSSIWLAAFALYVCVDGVLLTTILPRHQRFAPLRCCCRCRDAAAPAVAAAATTGSGSGSSSGGGALRVLFFYTLLAAMQVVAIFCYGFTSRFNALESSMAYLAALVASIVLCVLHENGGAAVEAKQEKEEDEEKKQQQVELAKIGPSDAEAGVVRGDDKADDGEAAAPPSSSNNNNNRGDDLSCIATCGRMTMAVILFVVSVLLLVSATYEANSYGQYAPNGTFVYITHDRTPSGCTITQRVLTQCVQPEGDKYNATLPTIWSEVGECCW